MSDGQIKKVDDSINDRMLFDYATVKYPGDLLARMWKHVVKTSYMRKYILKGLEET